MQDREFTELEQIYQRTIERLSGQIADLTANLSLAHAQIESLKEKEMNKNQEKNAE